MADRHAETIADLAELLAHGYQDASDDHNWMMAQSIYDLAVDPLRTALGRIQRTYSVAVDPVDAMGRIAREALAASERERIPASEANDG